MRLFETFIIMIWKPEISMCKIVCMEWAVDMSYISYMFLEMRYRNTKDIISSKNNTTIVNICELGLCFYKFLYYNVCAGFKHVMAWISTSFHFIYMGNISYILHHIHTYVHKHSDLEHKVSIYDVNERKTPYKLKPFFTTETT